MKKTKWGLFTCFRFYFIFMSFWLTGASAAGAQSLPDIFWEKTFGGSKSDQLTFLQQTPDGNYFVGGYTDSGQSKDKASAGHGLTDFWLLKLDARGSLIWEKTFGGNDQDIAQLLLQTEDGGCIIGGSSRSGRNEHKSQPNAGNFDYWIIRLDANGNKLWDKTYGGSGYDFLYSLQHTPDGGLLLGGYSDSAPGNDKTTSENGPHYWVLKLDAKGSKIWDKSFGSAESNAPCMLTQTPDGGFFLGGSFPPNGQAKRRPDKEYQVKHFDKNGSLLWEKSLGGLQDDNLTALEVTSDGGCLLGGVSASAQNGDKSQPSQGKTDFWIVKLDAAGNKKWDKTYGGKNADHLSSIHLTSDGGFLLGGHSSSGKGGDKTHNGKGKNDFWLVKTDDSGNKLWDETYGGAEEDLLFALHQTSDDGYLIGGVSDSPESGHKNSKALGAKDFWILKLNVLKPSWNSR